MFYFLISFTGMKKVSELWFKILSNEKLFVVKISEKQCVVCLLPCNTLCQCCKVDDGVIQVKEFVSVHFS